MTEIIEFNRFPSRLLSKDEMTMQFLEQSIRTLGYKLRKACDAKDQSAIEQIYDMLTKARRLLSDLQAELVTS